MPDFSLAFVLQFKRSKIINDMAKINIKSEKTTPFGRIFHAREREELNKHITSIIQICK